MIEFFEGLAQALGLRNWKWERIYTEWIGMYCYCYLHIYLMIVQLSNQSTHSDPIRYPKTISFIHSDFNFNPTNPKNHHPHSTFSSHSFLFQLLQVTCTYTCSRCSSVTVNISLSSLLIFPTSLVVGTLVIISISTSFSPRLRWIFRANLKPRRP